MITCELDGVKLEIRWDAGQIVGVCLANDLEGVNLIPWLNLPTLNRIKTAAALTLDKQAEARRKPEIPRRVRS